MNQGCFISLLLFLFSGFMMLETSKDQTPRMKVFFFVLLTWHGSMAAWTYK